MRPSPFKHRPLRILQCNINGLGTAATRIKLDQLLELAETKEIQIIALQETKLKETSKLKVKGYNVFRSDRKTGGAGGGLAFLVRNIQYQSIDTPQFDNTKLEIQGISFPWRGKNIKVFNSYHPPCSSSLPDCFFQGYENNIFFLGDLNAKHPNWGCSNSNARGNALLNLADDKSFLFLNDGSPTHSSHSYNTKEALDISIVSPDIYPQCNWTVLSNIGSDHYPILIELDINQKVSRDRRNHWNFRKADWKRYNDLTNSGVFNEPLTNNIDSNWTAFENGIISAAKQSVPRGKVKKYTPFFSHNSDTLKPLLKRREALSNLISSNSGNTSDKTELNRVNAEIKRKYALLKRQRWREFCTSLDSRTPESKLWKLVKSIDKSQPQSESCNTILAPDGSVPSGHKEAADILGLHYSNISKLSFTNPDKTIARRARILANRHRNKKASDPLFSAHFSLQELEFAIGNLKLSKSPGPDGIYGHMILHLGNLLKAQTHQTATDPLP
ncbi:uncharacterized protein LOC129216258 [Uloborus diversus]|uniref:uncharacterized protein LOC129216258 n=1 Tax=Uloborus diversus TaxID=327109 RepID=UPI00240A3615|nr:uncharacterized protein LOC129216258 [Uloborus diversus]